MELHSLNSDEHVALFLAWAVICGCTWFYAASPELYSSRTTGAILDGRCLNATALKITSFDADVVSVCVCESDFELFSRSNFTNSLPIRSLTNIVGGESSCFSVFSLSPQCLRLQKSSEHPLLDKMDGLMWLHVLLLNQEVLWYHVGRRISTYVCYAYFMISGSLFCYQHCLSVDFMSSRSEQPTQTRSRVSLKLL